MRHVEVLEERDSLRSPFLGSLAVHGIVFAAIAASLLIKPGQAEQWGDPNSAGGGTAVGVTAVKSIPLPSRAGPIQRLANDTQSQVPTPPKAEPKKPSRREDPDAIALKTKGAKQRASTSRYSPKTDSKEQPSNQLYSSVGQAAVSPIFGMAPGSGGVGVGTGTPFGTRFGAYAALLRDRVARQWRTDQVDARLRTLPPAIVTFEIQRNGQVSNIRVVQSSGNRALDYSAERAVLQASPFEPLPAAYGGSSAKIEFWFQLQR
ncbi:MAG: TonB family protein [Bryobacteraceae bacterium]|nr:TonB family protein [Bryobacteraceae bacterium]